MNWFTEKFRSYWLWVIASLAILTTWILVALGRRKQDETLRTRLQKDEKTLRSQMDGADRTEREATERVIEQAESLKASAVSDLPNASSGSGLTQYLKDTGTEVRK